RAFKIASGEWRVNKITSTHTNCAGGKTPGRSSALQHIADQAVKDNPGMTGVALKRKMQRDAGMKVGHRTATRMKNTSKKSHQAAAAGSYQQLTSLCAELQTGCPGTVAEVERNADGKFKRLFCMLGRAAYVCANSPFKLLCVDAGHLKGEWKGVMLVATCKDANNTLVQVATVVCDKENADYMWLYKMMKKNAEMKVLLDSPKTTIFTDQ
ncbi:unnamed protein product, partial [Pylaiella littoralis]